MRSKIKLMERESNERMMNIMKKLIISLLSITMLMGTLVNSVSMAVSPYVSRVSIEGQREISLNVGDEIKISATATPIGIPYAYMLWTCTDDSVELVNNLWLAKVCAPAFHQVTVRAVETGTATLSIYAYEYGFSESDVSDGDNNWLVHDSIKIIVSDNSIEEEEPPKEDDDVNTDNTDNSRPRRNRSVKKPVFNITFNTNGGNDIDNLKVKGNIIKSFPENPVREGYKFDGWYSDEEFKNKFTTNRITSSITLHAKWTEVETEEVTSLTDEQLSQLSISVKNILNQLF